MQNQKIKRISHDFGLLMIFIQRGVYFLSSSLGEDIENTQTVGQNHITS